MKMSEGTTFDFPELPLKPAPEGASILLTGEDANALESVFYRLVTAREDERSLILATETSGRTVTRELDRIAYGASNRATVLTCEGAADASNVEAVGDIANLTSVGMQFSALVTESGTVAAPQRAGVLFRSDICRRVTDMRSVFRFLNANFLTHLRRTEIMGVCGIDTSGTLDSDFTGVVESMQAAFSVYLRVEATDDETITIHITGPDRTDETVDMKLA